MTWTLLGIGRQDAADVAVRMPPKFTDETARTWFGSDKNLHRRMWALDADQTAAAVGMLDQSVPAEGTDYWLTYGTSWVVEAYNEADDQLALVFHLPPSFGFADAARWTGTWSIDVFGGEFPLEAQQLEELGKTFGVDVDTGRYAYFLAARSSAPATSAESAP
jgi:hypothetical protein